jgi:Spy/CpxP family protein refolding chaperone
MKKITKIIIGTMATVGIIAGSGAYAGKKFMEDMKGDFIIHKLDKKLDLSDDQVDRLKEIQSYAIAKRTTHKQHHDETKARMIALISSPNLDQTEVLAMMDEKMQTMRAEAPMAISKIAEFSDTLTDVQRAELLQMIEKMSKHRRHRGKHH